MTAYLVSGVALGSAVALAALGLVLLYRATGVLNFAYGSFSAAAGMVSWQLDDNQVPLAIAAISGTTVAVLLSLTYGCLVAPALSQQPPGVRAVATLGAALAVLGVLLSVWNDVPRSTSLPTDTTSFRLGGVQVSATQLICLLLALVCTAVCARLLKASWIGVGMRSLSDDRQLGALLGLPVRRIEVTSWGVSGALAGVTGILLADLVATDPNTLTFLVLTALAAGAVGRFHSLGLTLVGGIATGVLQEISTPVTAISPVRTAVPFLVAIVALLLQQRSISALALREA